MNAADKIMEPIASDTTRRKWIVGISTVGAIAGHLVSLYQHNVLKQSKPSALGAIIEKAENATHHNIKVPDAAVNLINYALTAWLARAGGKNRAQTHPIIPIAMGIKTIADSTVAMEMAREDWEKNHQIGTYPQIAAVASLSAAAVAVPEMVHGFRNLFNGR